MIKKAILFILINSNSLLAQEIGFHGCGKYLIKGILEKDLINKLNSSHVDYVVNAKTLSEMHFQFSDLKDLDSALSYLNQPTEIIGEIKNPLDGTKGKISHIEKIKLRKPDPLNNQDTGLFFISKIECDKI